MAATSSERRTALVEAVQDLELLDRPPAFGRGTAAHRELFARWVDELGPAAERAQAWYEVLLETELERTPDEEAAREEVEANWPAGAVSHVSMIAVVRKFWLECDALNASHAPGQRVPPEELLLLWLWNEGHTTLGNFLATLPYWPVGLNSDGHWC